MGRSELSRFLEAREFAKARVWVADPERLEGVWAGLTPLEKLAAFKLLEPKAAMAFFAGRGVEDRYLLFCGFERGSVAPLAEGSAAARTLFHQLGKEEYRAMLDLLSAPEAKR